MNLHHLHHLHTEAAPLRVNPTNSHLLTHTFYKVSMTIRKVLSGMEPSPTLFSSLPLLEPAERKWVIILLKTELERLREAGLCRGGSGNNHPLTLSLGKTKEYTQIHLRVSASLISLYPSLLVSLSLSPPSLPSSSLLFTLSSSFFYLLFPFFLISHFFLILFSFPSISSSTQCSLSPLLSLPSPIFSGL